MIKWLYSRGKETAMKKIPGKWKLFAFLIGFGLFAFYPLQGYDMTGYVSFGLAALIPIYHGLEILKSRRPKLGRRLFMIFTTCLSILLIAMGITLGIIASSARGTKDADANYLVVLGAGVNGTVPSRSLKERMDAAFVYLNEHPDAVAVVSGGQGPGEFITEAKCMYDYLTAAGISPDRVWMEDKASTTLENLRFSMDLIENKTGCRPGKVAIVSSEYHLHRAGMFARWLKLDAQLVPAKTEVFPLRWNYYIREIFALWYYTLIGGTTYA